MPKKTAKKQSPENVQKTLNAAANLLSSIQGEKSQKKSSPLSLTNNPETKNAKLSAVELHQPYCLDEKLPLGSATTDKTLAKNMAWLHEQQTGHDVDVISSE